MTNAQLVLNKIQEQLCHEGTTYKGNSGTYKFVMGRTTDEGTINGVVKKNRREWRKNSRFVQSARRWYCDEIHWYCY